MNNIICHTFKEFISQLITFNQSEMNLTEAFRKLNLSRIEFGAMGALPFYGQGEKCL
jgi:hypothetical protein